MVLIKNKLRVSHFPQIPCKPFIVEVKNEREAYLIYQTIANQHLFLFEGNFIPDYSNVICVEMWDDEMEADANGDKWCDYWNEKEEMEWNDFVEEYSDYVNGTDKT